MRVETEKEFKFQLSEKEFFKLKKYIDDSDYKKIEVVNQTNFYIDTEELALRSAGTTLRIRHFIDTNTFEFTAKIRKDTGEEDNELKIKEEITVDLPKKYAEDILNNNRIKEYLYLFEEKSELFNSEDIRNRLVILGSLSTERSNYFINEETMISFDKSNYLGVEDYEIELETKNIDKDREFLKKIFEENEIEVFQENKSKVKRFIEILRK